MPKRQVLISRATTLGKIKKNRVRLEETKVSSITTLPLAYETLKKAKENNRTPNKFTCKLYNKYTLDLSSV